MLIAITGGGELAIAGRHVSATSVGNPLTALALLAALRCWWRPARGFLGRDALSPLSLRGRVARWCEALLASPGPRPIPARRVLLALAAGSLALRIANAANPGFVTGDDVEINEMTLKALFGFDWPIWYLRAPFFPLTFIYPAQALALHAGVRDTAALVFAGRLSVVVLTTATPFVVYAIARRLTAHGATALLAAVLFATSRLHLWFGGTEFPRPVASLFLLAAFYLLLAPSRTRAAVAGALIGAGAAMRFGELVFFAPAALQLALARRYVDSATLLSTGAAAFGLVIGATDWLYWGSPLYSLLNIIDYAFVQGRSSSGFQPWFFYISTITTWTSVPVILLSLAAFRLADRRAAMWGWLPILLLSVLAHKELRYTIPVQPFLIIAAAMALRALMAGAIARRRETWLAALVAATLFAVAIELGNWRMRKTDEAVRLARSLVSSRVRGVAVQQVWRFGGRLYLHEVPTVIELATDLPGELTAASLDGDVSTVVLLRESATPEVERLLASRMFVRVPRGGSQYALFQRRSGFASTAEPSSVF